MDSVARLGDALRDAGFRGEGVARRIGVASMFGFSSADIPIYLRRLPRDDDTLNGLIRLFLLRAPVPSEHLERLLGPNDVADLVAAEVLEQSGATLRSRLTVLPDLDLLFASDHTGGVRLSPDAVLGPTAAARTLAAMTVRAPVGSALDMGTGCGIQALLAARHADRVVAVDVNPRALWMTELNCRLNGITNVDCRPGDLFDAVVGETFDLVVSNPPFVVSPAVEYVYRDSPQGGDEMSRETVRGAASALGLGGIAAVMCNWLCRTGEPWWAELTRWVEGLGCDAVLVHYETLDALSYAKGWNEQKANDPIAFGAALDRWLAYDASRGIEAVAMGAVILRRAAGAQPWSVPVALRRGPTGSAGAQVQRILLAQDALAGLDDEALLRLRFRGVEEHGLEQVLRFRGGAYAPAPAVVVLDDGLGAQNSVDPTSLHVLLRMDGQRSLGRLIADAAAETGLAEEALRRHAVPCLRELFGLGLVDLADPT